jgi:DNA primase large subunit
MFIKSVQTFMEHYLNENGMYPDAKDIAIAFEIDEATLKSRIGRNASQVLLQSFEDITEPVDTVTIERMILKDEIAQFMSTCSVHTRIVAELYMDSDDYTFEEAVRNISGTYGLKKSAAENIVEEALEAIIGFLENIGITKDDVEEVVSDSF